MRDQVQIRTKLLEELERKRGQNPRYSLRAFAKSLSLSPSALSEILSGKRRVSKAKALELAEKLCLAPDEKAQIEGLFNAPKVAPQDSTPVDYLKISAESFRVISEWYHFAILSLAETADFESNTQWIASRLNITPTDAKRAVERLLSLDLLVEQEDGSWRPTGRAVATTDDVVNLSLRKSHFKNLELARESLEKDSVEERDFTAITMAIDPEKLPEAKRRVREFRDSLCDFLESDQKTEVFKFCMQLFPLTKLETKNDDEIGEK